MTYDHIQNNAIVHTGNLASDYFRILTGYGDPDRLGDAKLREYGVLPRVKAVLGEKVVDGEIVVDEALAATQKHGAVQIEAERTFVPAIPKTVEDIKAETYVYQITPRQCRLWLAQAELLAGVEAAIVGMGDAARIEWEYALEIKRDHPLVFGMQQILQKTDDEMHQMFWEASQL